MFPSHLARVLVVLTVSTWCVPAAAAGAAKGPLRMHPQNPRYFTDGTKAPDGSLRAIYLTGSHHWDNLQDGYNPEVTPFDYARYLDLLQKNHHNFIRLWAWEHVAAKNSWHYEHREQRFDPMPYERTGPGLALDGKPKVDLRKLTPAYFERLRRRVQMADKRGIYVGIMLFQGVAGTGPATWPGHVFNKNNNVKAHPATADWQYEMIQYIKGYEEGKPKQHPVGMTCRGDEPDNEVLFRSPADWVSPGTYKLYAASPPAADGRKVSLLDTDHVFGVGGDRPWIWKAFTRGHNPIYMDPLWGHIPDKGHWKDHAAQGEDARRAMGQTHRFAERMNLAAMTPQSELSSTKYCLAKPGREYLVYQPKAGEAFSVELRAGTYRYEWFDLAKGAVAGNGSIASSGKAQQFRAPFQGDAVLYLQSQSK